MKELKLYALLVMAMMAAACSDRDDNPVTTDKDGNAVEVPAKALPTADALTETTNVPVAVLGSSFSDVAQAFVARLKHPIGSLTAEAKAVLVKGSDMAQHISDIALKEAIKRGVVLIIDQPTCDQLEAAVDWIYPSKDLDVSMGGEEHDHHICYDMVALDNHENFYTLNDIFDEDEDRGSELELTPYLNGLHADPLARWLNEYAGNETSPARRVTRAASGDLSSLMSAQNITRTYTLKPSGDDASRLEGRQCVFTMSTNIWAVYKFDEDADYYLVEQTVLGNNANFWTGKWTSGKWEHQGFFLSKVIVNNKLFHDLDFYHPDYVLKQQDKALLIDYSPTTTQGQRTISVEESWNLGGEIGLIGGGLSGGISGGIGGSVGTSYSVEDMTIHALCANDNNCYNNAAWEFVVNSDNYDFSGWSGYSFHTPPLLGTGGYKSAQCWQWKVERPGRYGDIKLIIDLGFDHTQNSFRNKTFTGYSQNKTFFNGWFSEFITIRPPRRNR